MYPVLAYGTLCDYEMTHLLTSLIFEFSLEVHNVFKLIPHFPVTALALASFECEAPDNAPEKEHFKSLKR